MEREAGSAAKKNPGRTSDELPAVAGPSGEQPGRTAPAPAPGGKDLLALQQAAGNLATRRLVQRAVDEHAGCEGGAEAGHDIGRHLDVRRSIDAIARPASGVDGGAPSHETPAPRRSTVGTGGAPGHDAVDAAGSSPRRKVPAKVSLSGPFGLVGDNGSAGPAARSGIVQRNPDNPFAQTPVRAEEEEGIELQELGGEAEAPEGGWQSKTGEFEFSTKSEGGTTTNTAKAQLGEAYSSESNRNRRVGSAGLHTEGSTEAMKGLEVAVNAVSTATDDEISKAIEIMARAGVFGETKQKAVLSRGPLTATAEGSAGGLLGAEAEAKLAVEYKSLIEGLTVLGKAGVFVGAKGELEGSLKAQLGESVAATLAAKGSAFAGAMAEASGELNFSLVKGITAKGEASAKAGAGAEGEASVTLQLSDVEVAAAIKGEVFAGAKAEASGELTIGLSGVAVSGKAEAMAGLSSEVSGSGELKYKGRSIFKATGTLEVDAGVGGKAEATFEFKDGTLKIGGGLAAALGIGGGVKVEAEIDFIALTYAIGDVLERAFAKKQAEISELSPDRERPIAVSEERQREIYHNARNAVLEGFSAYKQAQDLRGEPLTREGIQQVIQANWGVLQEASLFIESDKGIRAAAAQAFGRDMVDIDIQVGVVRSVEINQGGPRREPREALEGLVS